MLSIFSAKGRPADNPLIVHIHSRDQLEPLCQIPQCIELIKAVKDYDNNLNIWLYTGYKFEEAKKLDKFNELLPYLDVIVDGRYVEELRDLSLNFRGSSNQRLIRLKEKTKSEVD